MFKWVEKPEIWEARFKFDPGVTVLISLDLIRDLVGLCGFTEACLLTTLCVLHVLQLVGTLLHLFL